MKGQQSNHCRKVNMSLLLAFSLMLESPKHPSVLVILCVWGREVLVEGATPGTSHTFRDSVWRICLSGGTSII